MSQGKISAFRFSDDELAMLEMIQGHTGTKSRTEALRAVLDFYLKHKPATEGASTEPGAEGDAGPKSGSGDPR